VSDAGRRRSGCLGVHRLHRQGDPGRAGRALDGDDATGTTGIGHTRWATHGEPTDPNAHPHTDAAGDLALIHNGIIENFAELKAELAEAGHDFSSQTDTEVLAHLVGECYSDAGDLAEAVRAALRRARGAFAVAVVDRREPDTIVAARR
jgi:glucosamine--fructose-6-phosphate aminotransferase (isomerizing)